MNFNSILIGSANPKGLIAYYTKLFGKPAYEYEAYAGWQIGSGFVTVGPHDQVSGANGQPGRLIWNIESTDVQGDFDRLTEAGAIVVRAPYAFEEAADAPPSIATLADPDDNYFQLMSPMEMDPQS
jgi:predicted enzyme related to lactoylglutathione lyase